MINTTVIFKTHVWSKFIADYCVKLLRDCNDHHVDFHVIIHDENNILIDSVANELLPYILFIKESDICIYNSGYINMWFSNHWILMWFWLQYKNKYKYVWSIEYDVRITGDTGILWTINNNDDFLYTLGNTHSPNNKYKDYYFGTIFNEHNKYYGHLQLARYSRKALNYLHYYYKYGENGQDELITYSLLHRSNLKMSNILSQFIAGRWTWDSKESLYNTHLYYQYIKNKPEHIKIFHPIKNLNI